jgi:NAD(P)-dependent dehydrogenase (short-subunit alcohol dehydrogenase family)
MSSSNPTIILTGASRGLGLAVLRILLSKHQANVVTLSRTISPELSQVKEDNPKRVVTITGDVGVAEDNKKAVKAAVDTFGGIDGVIINAGSIEPIGPSISSLVTLSPS